VTGRTTARLRLGLAVVAAGAGAVALLTPPADPAGSAAPSAAPEVTVSAAAARGPAPVRLKIPALGVDTAVPVIGLDAAGALVPPDDVAVAGWYGGGPAPGEVGPAVVAGHVDSVSGPGVFFRLRQLAPGSRVLVTRADGSVVRFAVTRVERYAKTAFPTAEVYRPTAGAELRLVTCGGAFDRAARSYVDNVVVYAREA
jgi:sortase (surface protein transpeptidase)